MTISRFWNAASWALLACLFMAPVLALSWQTLSEMRAGQTPHFSFVDPAVMSVHCILMGIGGLAMLASFDQFRRFLDERALRVAQSDFVSAVTHELRTPLTTIKLYAEMLRAGAVPEAQQAEFWDGLESECDRLGRLVEDVVTYRSAQSGSDKAKLAPHRADALVQEALAATRPALTAAGMAVETEIPAGLVVHVDRDMVVRALVNLISNAAKYAASGGRVRIEACVGARAVTFVVRDFGPGIPAGERRKVFEPFYRIGSELTRERDGMGLGLALAKAAAIGHRGRLDLDTEEGHGATFSLVLPVRHDAA